MSVPRHPLLSAIAGALFVLAVVAACLAAWATRSVAIGLLVLLVALSLIGGTIVCVALLLRLRRWTHRQVFAPREPSDQVS